MPTRAAHDLYRNRLWSGVLVVLSVLYLEPLRGDTLDQNWDSREAEGLRQWHPDAASRCYRFDRPHEVNQAASRFGAIFAYLRRDRELAGYLLATARRAGVAFCIEDRADGTRGYYDYNHNVIAVREQLSLQQQTAIVVHELRHVAHVQQGYRQSLDYAMPEVVRLTFAVEADVQAFSALFAWRLKQRGETGLWHTLLGFAKYADIARAFESEIGKSGDELAAMRAAFRQWYTSPWRTTGYYRNAVSGYLDMLDESHLIEQYRRLPGNFFDRLCVLPDGRNYGCQDLDVIGTIPGPPASNCLPEERINR
ncbi:DUF6782 family putative metallopeptidase [Sedimenticola hydrogenitrophicus]|uniref:DUF6782 family putative metallopeptidase n=1 Tax=Sedimenticola hydrogenitrophicus TaxID=2967975 RepID=UPI0023AF92F7|nr:DUF6782 family putative metallopeptidase [Sedimenticola hydrogenitrophicus]